jgi:hypothetical protein
MAFPLLVERMRESMSSEKLSDRIARMVRDLEKAAGPEVSLHEPYPALQLAGAELWLLPDKAIYYPAEQALLIADAHFGKAAAYRKLGQPVPHGTTDDNVRRLDAMLNAYDCRS